MSDDELLLFDDSDVVDAESALPPWRVLVVDDDPEVHQVTRLVLQNARLLGRPIEIVDSYSMAESMSLLAEDRDFAVVWLDVVMETPDAGLRLITHIRAQLFMLETRIILRTGQPGYAPELEVFAEYDINDYHSKTELTHARLMTAMTAALRSYEQIETNRRNTELMERIARESAKLNGQHTLQSLSQQGLASLESILGRSLSGLFAAQVPAGDDTPVVGDDPGHLRILASQGSLAAHCDAEWACLPAATTDRVTHCLNLAQHLFEGEHCTLYLYGEFLVAIVLLEIQPPPSPVERQAIHLFAANLNTAFATANLFEQLHFNATHDHLTSLWNRQHLINHLDEHPHSEGRHDVLALLDINNFAEVNDALGDELGDELLRSVGERLSTRLAHSHIARIGGDVFAVVGPESEANPGSLLHIFDTPCQVGDNNIPVSVTLGLRQLNSDGGDGISLLKSANIALSRAKKSVVTHFEYFLPEMEEHTQRHLEIIRDLRQAFDAEKLDVWFQPQINLFDGRVSGMEALIRWPNEHGGFVHPPNVFIPLAEDSGLIIDIGQWVLERSADALIQLDEEGLFGGRVAVNVSMPQFRTQSFVHDVAEVIDVLKLQGLQPDRLELEITESIAMDEPKVVQRSFHALKEIGVRIAIDDFGTGYSSMGQLRALPIDTIKVDQMFVREIAQGQGALFAETIIGMSKRLGVETVAEGVETEEQASLLRQLGCSDAQGWLYARAMPIPELRLWLQHYRQQTSAT